MKYPLLKVIVLGDSCVGRYVNSEFNQLYKSSIGIDFLSKNVAVDEQTATMQIWDTAGEERFNALASVFFRGADACVLVFDVLDRKSFEGLERWHEQFFSMARVAEEDADSFPCLVIGNKIDAVHDGEGVRAYDTQELEEWCNSRNCSFIECSAKANHRVDEAFLSVATSALARLSKDALNVAQLVADAAPASLAPSTVSHSSFAPPASEGCAC